MQLAQNPHTPRLSVVMPTFQQAHFLADALESLLAQTFADWELIVIVDGAADATFRVLERFQNGDAMNGRAMNGRMQAPRLGGNRGLGAALNVGLDLARANLIAYLPSDDFYDAGHLENLVAVLENSNAIAAFSGVRHHESDSAIGQIPDFALQLVQTAHRLTDDRWLQRDELTTDDLHRMFWHKLESRGEFAHTNSITCEWRDHLHQRHKVVREDLSRDDDPYLNAGLNAYRARYNASEPLRYHSSVGNLVDEIALYQRFRERPATPRAPDGLKILLAGELAFNPERVLALEERGHQLFGLWMPNPGSFNAVGPMPFGHVTELARDGWQQSVQKIKPDIIYAQLNWRAVPFAHQVLMNNPGATFVWHFKEGPFHCRDRGTWNQLVDLHTRSHGQIYTSPEMRDWFFEQVPQTRDGLSFVLDGDLPKREWHERNPSPRLSAQDGEIHTLLAGRPLGLDPATMGAMAHNGIHFHVYGEMKGMWLDWLDWARRVAPRHFHQHAAVAQDKWVKEFSQYDAALLHLFRSENGGDMNQVNWDDLNYPARISTYVAAGLPLIQFDNATAIFASDALARRHDIGVFFSCIEELAEQLRDQKRMAQLQENVWRAREQWTFDFHADDLIAFFRAAIQRASGA